MLQPMSYKSLASDYSNYYSEKTFQSYNDEIVRKCAIQIEEQ